MTKVKCSALIGEGANERVGVCVQVCVCVQKSCGSRYTATFRSLSHAGV